MPGQQSDGLQQPSAEADSSMIQTIRFGSTEYTTAHGRVDSRLYRDKLHQHCDDVHFQDPSREIMTLGGSPPGEASSSVK